MRMAEGCGEEAAWDVSGAGGGGNHVELQRRLTALAEAQAEADRLYARWAELEAKSRGEG
jgi:hypothetical protein